MTKKTSREQLSDLFDGMRKSVMKNGVSKTIQILNKGNYDLGTNEVIFNYCVDLVLKEWGEFSKGEILKAHTRGESTVARNTIIIITRKVTGIKLGELSNLSSIHYKTLSLIIKKYDELDWESRIDRITIDRTERLLLEVEKHIKKNNITKKK